VLAILTTHPIQYQVPVWKALAARGNVPFKVLYMSDQGLQARFDAGFGKSISWDIELLEDYQCEFLNTHSGARLDSFWRLRLKRGFGRVLHQMGATVLWIQGWQVAAYWQAVLEARKAGTAIWLRAETNSCSNAHRIGRQFRRQLLRQLLRRVDRFLYIGEANRRFYLEQGVSGEQLAPAPYCVDNDRFAAAARATRTEREWIREKWGIPAKAFCFLFAGKFLGSKRPFDLIEAARRLQQANREKRIHLLWVGTGELASKLRQACDVRFDGEAKGQVNPRSRSEPTASFVGFLNQSEISRAYVAADCLVLPSDTRETWGLVVNEAMASDLPCVVSNGCGCVEDLITPIRPDLCYPLGDITALENSMAAAMFNTPPPQLLRAHISKYNVIKTLETVERLYLEQPQFKQLNSQRH
jgi:glycosyltransferase involved in cell wall biosynthesis